MSIRFGQMIRLKPDGVEVYIHRHAEVWPAVLKTIKACKIQNYSIYFKDNYLFSYFEYIGDDFNSDMLQMASDPETQRWWNLVKPLLDPIETREPGEFWANMEEVFHLA